MARAAFEESQAANERVRQTQERFELALRGADLGAWDWNVKSGEAIFNPRWAEIRGFRMEEIRPHVDSWSSGVHPDDWPGVQKALADHFQGIVPEYDPEFRAKTKSGDWVWIRARGKVFTRDEKGQPQRMLGIEADISERKRFDNEQRFLAEVGAVLSSSLDIDETLGNIARLAVRDLGDLCIIDLNEEGGGSGLLKVMSRDTSKGWISDLFLRLPLNRHRPGWLRTVLESKRPVLMERLSPEAVDVFCRHPEHTRALWEAGLHSALAVPLVAHGNLLGAIVLLSFSPSHAYGPADLRLAQELAERSALSIENSQLYLEAQRAIKTRENVLAMVSHDLRNPLATIGLVTHVLQQDEPMDAGRLNDLAGKIQRAVDQMRLLISALVGGEFQIRLVSLSFYLDPIPLQKYERDQLCGAEVTTL
jgi:PAS domain S-box-containing protein